MYINHLTFINDVKIIFKTIGKVFKREGISQDGEATMERFDITQAQKQNVKVEEKVVNE